MYLYSQIALAVARAITLTVLVHVRALITALIVLRNANKAPDHPRGTPTQSTCNLDSGENPLQNMRHSGK